LRILEIFKFWKCLKILKKCNFGNFEHLRIFKISKFGTVPFQATANPVHVQNSPWPAQHVQTGQISALPKTGPAFVQPSPCPA
jgi:hypothetical protein